MAEPTGREEKIKKLAELITEIDFAMLTTVAEDGTLHSRPMSTQRTEFDGDLWFFTRASAPKVGEIEHEHQVNVAYAKPEAQTYVSVSGRATVVRDRAKIGELWSPELKAWFPAGPDDPDIALLRVAVERAEYWDSPSSAVSHAVSFVKALVTGQPANPGDNEKLELGRTAGSET
jgi:general stress protein 26